MAIYIEKFGGDYNDYMHGGNFMTKDMMLVDSPRILTEDEKKSLKKKNNTVKVNTMEEMEKQMKKMLG